MNIVISLIVGLIAGWLAGVMVRGRGLGVIGDTIVGLIGGLVGAVIFSLAGLESSNILGSILISFIGATVLLIAVKTLKRA